MGIGDEGLCVRVFVYISGAGGVVFFLDFWGFAFGDTRARGQSQFGVFFFFLFRFFARVSHDVSGFMFTAFRGRYYRDIFTTAQIQEKCMYHRILRPPAVHRPCLWLLAFARDLQFKHSGPKPSELVPELGKRAYAMW